MTENLQSFEPATGALLWEGLQGDVDADVERAASAWTLWAGQPVTTRMEAMRRFANVVRGRDDALSDLIARETSKPLWEARMEVSSVIARVDMHIMTTPAVCVGEETLVSEIARIFSEKHINRVPVVDSSGRLVGIVSRADIVRYSFAIPQ